MPPLLYAKTSFEDYFLLEGHFLGLKFDEGFVFVRITGRERTNIKPFELGSVAAASAQTSFNKITSSAGDSLLTPDRDSFIFHFFVGIRPNNVRLYVNFPAGAAFMNLRGGRPVPSAIPTPAEESIGYIDGYESPFETPNPLTEIFTVYQLYPEYKAHNPTLNNIPQVLLNFPIMKYTYRIMTDINMAKNFIDGVRRIRLYSVGGVTAAPAPAWLLDKPGVLDIAKLTKQLLAAPS